MSETIIGETKEEELSEEERVAHFRANMDKYIFCEDVIAGTIRTDQGIVTVVNPARIIDLEVSMSRLICEITQIIHMTKIQKLREEHKIVKPNAVPGMMANIQRVFKK